MDKRIKLTDIKQFSVSNCLTLDIKHKDNNLEVILVRYSQAKYAAYINRCPHTGVNLNWQADQCFDVSEKYLMCSLHGALFRPEDGHCIYGPCTGQSLSRLPIEIDKDEIFIHIDCLNHAKSDELN